MNKKEIFEKYGEKIINEVSEAGYLDGVTVGVNKDGEIDIPEEDIILAIRRHKGEKIGSFEWD